MRHLSHEVAYYKPALYLDRVLPRSFRRVMRMFLLGVMAMSALSFMALTTFDTSGLAASFTHMYFLEPDVYLGLFCISVSILFALYFLSCYFYTRYYRGLTQLLSEDAPSGFGITFETAAVLINSKSDMTKALLESNFGRRLMVRCGVPAPAVAAFIDNQKRLKITRAEISLPSEKFFTPGDLALQLFNQDQSLIALMQDHGVATDVFAGATKWVEREIITSKHHGRWWSRDNLSNHRRLGQNLAYGVAYELNRYVKSLYTSSVFSTFTTDEPYAAELVERVEATLTRSQSANIMLIGEPGVGKGDVMVAVARRLERGVGPALLKGYKVVVFDEEAFVAVHNDKQSFEPAFLKLLAQAEQAGNIILVIEDVSSFLNNVETIGSNAGELIERFLSSPELHVVGTDVPDGYHQYTEKHPQLLQKFETVYIEDPALSSVLRVLQSAAEVHEIKYGVFFTFAAVSAIAEGADRYIVEGVMPQKAIELLSEIVSRTVQHKRVLITRSEVDLFIREKTGIPVGPINDDERRQLLHLENILHQRVVGQDRAVTAIAGAMRRARSGITSKDRPLGSFLFLGSTGVGKTETAKALAETFFGSEDNMIRIDMSEFNSDEALPRLIGFSGESGMLATQLREHPYTVLLLDEFEKAAPEVHDLFLQILDEGEFTDARGKKVNAHNTIIVATSNAGSEKIWEMAQAGKNPAEAKDDIVDDIISSGTFKPELINRFDGAIIFETLGESQQVQVARLLLKRLRDRIARKGYQLEVNEPLIAYVAEKGFDPEFGARPMRRIVQDDIEEKIATKIISGGLRAGDTISFSKSDLSS